MAHSCARMPPHADPPAVCWRSHTACHLPPHRYEKLGSYALCGLPDDLYPTRYVEVRTGAIAGGCTTCSWKPWFNWHLQSAAAAAGRLLSSHVNRRHLGLVGDERPFLIPSAGGQHED